MAISEFLLTGIVAVSALVYLRLQRSKQMPYPPGPKGLPVVGNLLDVPPSAQWEAYASMGQELGSPIVHVNLLGTHIISVNELESAREIFEKRGGRHGDRPPLPMIRKICGHNWNFGYYPYDSEWKACRRNFDMYLRQSESRKFRPLETRVARDVLQRFIDTPEDFVHHARFFATATMLEVAYGITINDSHDPFIDIAEHSLEAVNESANYQLVDAMPWLIHLPGWLPGMSWKAKTGPWREANQRMRDIPFDAVKKAVEEHVAKTSVTSQLLETQEGDDEKEKGVPDEIIKSVAATIIAGGVDTVVSILLSFILIMKTYPDIQSKAQAEIDRVVGSDRLPEFDDKPQLPYVQAVCKELLRYVSVTPVALPHRAMEDDIWCHEGKEYRIPKGAIMLSNVWAMTRDPKYYPNPTEFKPSRFLNKEGQLDPNVQEPDMVFGFRPRHCPGRWMAEDVLFIYAASILSTLDISRVPGEDIGSTKFEALFKPGLAIYPRDFRCKIVKRYN